MKNKTAVFASQGITNPNYSEVNYTSGMSAHTIAYAEDVNSFGNEMDTDLLSVCEEVVHVLTEFGITPDENNNYQLINAIKQHIAGMYGLTGLDFASYTNAPTQSNTTISFPAMDIIFNDEGYYGSKISNFTKVHFDAQTLTASSSDATGVWFIYATKTGQILKQQSPVLGSESKTKCMLGSVFIVNPSGFQPDSWKFQPWLTIASQEMRESPVAETKGGYISSASATTIQMGALEIKAEGINFDYNPQAPNIMNVTARSPFTYKFLYNGYDPSTSEASALDTTKLFNLTSGQMETLNTTTYGDKFMVMVPCITPSGQTLMVPAMSEKVNGTYTQLFDSVEEATAAIYGLKYSTQSVSGLAKTTSRAIYFGLSIVVQVGATDLTDQSQFAIVGTLPQELAGFTNVGGQTGGASGNYIPMPEVTWNQAQMTLANNCSNVIIGNTTSNVNIFMPTVTQGITNTCLIKYTHVSGNKPLVFNNVRWWTNAPTYSAGKTYMFTADYINGSWYIGYVVG